MSREDDIFQIMFVTSVYFTFSNIYSAIFQMVALPLQYENNCLSKNLAYGYGLSVFFYVFLFPFCGICFLKLVSGTNQQYEKDQLHLELSEAMQMEPSIEQNQRIQEIQKQLQELNNVKIKTRDDSIFGLFFCYAFVGFILLAVSTSLAMKGQVDICDYNVLCFQDKSVSQQHEQKIIDSIMHKAKSDCNIAIEKVEEHYKYSTHISIVNVQKYIFIMFFELMFGGLIILGCFILCLKPLCCGR